MLKLTKVWQILQDLGRNSRDAVIFACSEPAKAASNSTFGRELHRSSGFYHFGMLSQNHNVKQAYRFLFR